MARQHEDDDQRQRELFQSKALAKIAASAVLWLLTKFMELGLDAALELVAS